MKNVTVTLDEHIARWARIEAARNELSLSRFLSRLLEERMRAEESYDVAMERFLSRGPAVLKRSAKYPKREELHER